MRKRNQFDGRGGSGYQPLPAENAEAALPPGSTGSASGRIVGRPLRPGDEDYTRIWHEAHRMAREEMPWIKSGIRKQPGLAAMLANFAIKEANNVIARETKGRR